MPSRDPDIDMLCRNIQMEQNMDRIWARIHSFAGPFFLRLDARIKQKRLRLAVHCLGSAPTGLTSGVGRDRKSAAVGLDGEEE